MKKLVIFILMFFISFQFASAQTKKIQKAKQYYENGNYSKALEIYTEVFPKLKDKTTKAEVSFYAGLCAKHLFDINGQIRWFKRAVLYKYQDPKSNLYLADAYKYKGLYEEAIKYYKNYKDLVPNDPIADINIKACQNAIEWKEKPTRYIVTPVRTINSTKSNEFAPALSDDTLKLFFTSSRENSNGNKINPNTGTYFTDIYYSQLDKKGNWTVPKPIEGDVNTEFDDGACFITANGLTMYYTSCISIKGKKIGCKIYKATWTDGKWTNVKQIQIFKDTAISVGQPALSPDGLTMYFATDNPKGKGGKDIWFVTRNSTSSDNWSNPQPLTDINSPYNEIYPYMDKNGTLYFASDRPDGMGGFDIYKATKKENGGWIVENMKYPINTSFNDFSIVFFPNQERGFLASSRKYGKDDDIYKFWKKPLNIKLVGYIRNRKNHAYLSEATVEITASDGSKKIVKTNSIGKFEVNLKENTDFYILAYKPTFLKNHTSISTKGIKKDTVLHTEIFIIPNAGNIQIPNIYYDFNDSTLRPESFASLDTLIEILEINPDVKIEIRAHTDYRGTDEANLKLSQGRANSVVKYLINHGISKDRLVAKGLGESEPFVVDELTAKKYPFLKPGQKLTQQFIESLPSKEQQEICNELNRRTEFRVLESSYNDNYEVFGSD